MKNLIYMNLTVFFIMFILLMMINQSSLHPIFIMIIIIIYTTLLCLNMSLWNSNYIYSLLLFLMMISGLMNIFLYFSSLISNNSMYFIYNKFNMIFSMILFLLLFFLIYKYMYMTNINYNFKETMSLNKINKNFFSLLYMYVYPFNNITIMSMCFLLMTLITIIKILSNKNKPLRKIL